MTLHLHRRLLRVIAGCLEGGDSAAALQQLADYAVRDTPDLRLAFLSWEDGQPTLITGRPTRAGHVGRPDDDCDAIVRLAENVKAPQFPVWREVSGPPLHCRHVLSNVAPFPPGSETQALLFLRRESIDGESKSSLEELGQLLSESAGIIRLHERNVERAREARSQLAQAQKLQALGRLAGGIAHDFNNLITGLQGFVELAIAEAPAGGPTREYLQEASEITDRARDLTHKILSLSRRTPDEPETFRPLKVLQDLAKLLRRTLGDQITIDLSGRSQQSITMSRSGFEHIILNLAINARDAMPDGGSLIVEAHDLRIEESLLSTESRLSAGDYVQVSVSDNGEGMDEATAARALEPFFTTKRAGAGTGLGLSMVHQIVEDSRGEVVIYSESGYGTTVKVFLPASRSAVPTEEAPRRPAESRGREHIFLVEDEDLVRRLLVRVLSRAGYRVSSFGDPLECLRQVDTAEVSPDLLLTDVMMPGMTGPELAKRFERLPSPPPTLFMSGYTEPVAQGRNLVEDDVSFITKPFQASVLLEAVRVLLDRRSQTDNPRSEV